MYALHAYVFIRAVHKVMLCVSTNIMGCEIAKKTVIEGAMDSSLKMFKEKCPAPTKPPVVICKPAPPPTPVCKVERAYLECMKDVTLDMSRMCT